MQGLLKSKPAGTQFIVMIGIALGSFFILGMLLTLGVTQITGVSLEAITDPDKWKPDNTDLINTFRGLQAVQFICLFLIPSFICARLFSTDSKKYLGLVSPSDKNYFIAGTAVLLLAIPLVTFLGQLNQDFPFPKGIENWLKESEERAGKQIGLLLSGQTISDLVLNLICIAGLAAVGEELLFRGIAQRLLIKLFKSPLVGIIVAAFLFSAMHMQFYGFLPRFFLGILLGLVYWYSGSLWTTILAHFIYDATLIILAYNDPSMIGNENTLKLSGMAMAASISFVLVALLVIWMKKRSTVTYQQVYADDAIPVKDHPF